MKTFTNHFYKLDKLNIIDLILANDICMPNYINIRNTKINVHKESQQACGQSTCKYGIEIFNPFEN
jgi:hypothetical protein